MTMSYPSEPKRYTRLRRLAYWLRQSVTNGNRLDINGWLIARQLRDAETSQQADEALTNYKSWKMERAHRKNVVPRRKPLLGQMKAGGRR